MKDLQVQYVNECGKTGSRLIHELGASPAPKPLTDIFFLPSLKENHCQSEAGGWASSQLMNKPDSWTCCTHLHIAIILILLYCFPLFYPILFFKIKHILPIHIIVRCCYIFLIHLCFISLLL